VRAALAALGVAAVALAAGAGTGGASGQGTTTTTALTFNSTIPASTAAVDVRPDIPYLDDGPTLDAYVPSGGGTSRPAIVMVHSGGWSEGSSAELAPWAMQAATEQQWVAFSIDYALDGDGTSGWPEELHDVQAAIRWVAANAAEYGVDPGRIVILGASAGGNLAALVSTYGTADAVAGSAVGAEPAAAVRINAVALWSPPVDLAALVPTGAGAPPPGCDRDAACDLVWSAPDVVDYVGCDPAACPSTYRAASPLEVVSSATAPTFIANSSDELVPIGQIEQYVEALEAAGVAHRFEELPGSRHSSQYGDDAWRPTVAFLEGYVGGGPDDGPSQWLVAGVAGVAVVGLGVALIGGRARLRSRRRVGS
jgi:acetyl esterase/lipase